MMKLWIDGQCLQTPSRLRGIGRYVQELIRALSEVEPRIELSISFNAAMLNEAMAARDNIRQWMPPQNIHMWNGIAEAGEVSNGYTERRKLSELAIAHHVACLNPDVALSASPFEGESNVAVPLMPSDILDMPVASIFFDAIPYRFPDQYLATAGLNSYYHRRLAFYRDFHLNLCISEYSQTEAVNIFGNERSVNISAGISPDFLALLRDPVANHPTLSNRKFVLYVGGLDWRKNVEGVVDAFAGLPNDLRGELDLVLAGDHPESRLTEIRNRWLGRGLSETNFVALGHVSDRDLVSLYRLASLVVQPSLLEGFGLTALEAMTCGTPVIGSSAGALPEVIRNSDLLFDPQNPVEIADCIVRMFRDTDFVADTVQAGRERARQFTWRKSAGIAANALMLAIRRYSPRSSHANRQELRTRTFEASRATKVPSDLVAETLARAEPMTLSKGSVARVT